MTAVLPVMPWPVDLNTWIRIASTTIQARTAGGLFQETALKGKESEQSQRTSYYSPVLASIQGNSAPLVGIYCQSGTGAAQQLIFCRMRRLDGEKVSRTGPLGGDFERAPAVELWKTMQLRW